MSFREMFYFTWLEIKEQASPHKRNPRYHHLALCVDLLMEA
jgi:hypothetical protein